MKWTIYLLAIFLMMTSCVFTNSDRLEKILNSDELYIQQNTYGGIGGYHEQQFHLKKGEFETLLIIDEGTDYQTFIRMEGKEALLRTFLREAFATNDLQKSMSNSCVTGIDSEYIVSSGFTKLTLRPSEQSDSIFSLIVYRK